MALSFSPRVMKNMAMQMSFSHHQSGSSSRYTRLVFAFISNEVTLPTSPEGIHLYLNTCLNNSANDGTFAAGYNQRYILGWFALPASGAQVASKSGNLLTWQGPFNITANETGTIGSVVCFAPTHVVTDGMSVTQGSGGATSTTSGSGLVLTNTSTNSAGAVMIGSGMTSANYNLYAPEYYSSLNFITDSVGTSGTPIVKVNSMTTTQGQVFQMSGFKLRINSLNN